MIVVEPRLFRSTEYMIELASYDVRDVDVGDADHGGVPKYEIELGAGTQLPPNGRLVLALHSGAKSKEAAPAVFYISRATKTSDDNALVFSLANKELDKVGRISKLNLSKRKQFSSNRTKI